MSIRIDQSPPASEAAPDQGIVPGRPVSPEDEKLFRDQYEQGPGTRSQGAPDWSDEGTQTATGRGRADDQPALSGQALLSSLFGGGPAGGPAPTGQLQVPAPADGGGGQRAELQRAVDQLVERILVSEPSRDGGAEVRLTFNDTVLPHTEVALRRQADGQLYVRLIADTPEAFQTLVTARDDLLRGLETRESRGVRIEVTGGGGTGAEDGRDRQSRGHAAYDPFRDED